MIDTKELRSAVESASLNAISREEVLELIERLEAAESDALEQARLNGMGASREATLMAKLEAAEKSDAESIAMYRKARDERDALRAAVRHEADCVEAAEAEIESLRAKIAEMEQQEPVAWATKLALEYGASTLGFRVSSVNIWGEKGVPLYALPGAQQCRNCNGMGDRFDPSGEKIPCDLCESNLEEIRVLVAEAAHNIISGGDFWLSTSLAAKKIAVQLELAKRAMLAAAPEAKP